ncbi:hypothetical protein M514_03490 [Trichuris suis]|uniref:Uncharacterized protein n=1 Tax=Trichuris suis TaxID=68888 RepID=A0A085MEU6_9BILA|nr:hypothetical protein M513_03490 [Trichuris suis]KFD67570.1 hypothetical protein M514_03490 [Trichuris suis]
MLGEKEKLLNHEEWLLPSSSNGSSSPASGSLQEDSSWKRTAKNGERLTLPTSGLLDASANPFTTAMPEGAIPVFPESYARPSFQGAQMTKQDLLRLARDFKSGKLAIFKTDDGLASMRAIRKKQEKLMNLHLTLAQEEMTESVLEEKPRKKIQENSKLLMDEFAELVEMIDEFNSRRRNSEASRQLGLDDFVQPGYDQNPDPTSL